MVVDRNTGKVLKIHEMQNNETGREKPEEILDKLHYANTECVRSISTDHFPQAYKETALQAMREYAINFGNEVKKACAETVHDWSPDNPARILSIDVESLIEKG